MYNNALDKINSLIRNLSLASSGLFGAVRIYIEGLSRSTNWLKLDRVEFNPLMFNRAINHNRSVS